MDLVPFCPWAKAPSTGPKKTAPPARAAPFSYRSVFRPGVLLRALLLLAPAAAAARRRRGVSWGRTRAVAGRAGRAEVAGRAGARRGVRAAVSGRWVTGVAGRAGAHG